MVSGVLAHQMSASQAQLLAASNISWVSSDVTFNPSDTSQWNQVFVLAKQYHLSLMGILDQHLMNYSNSFTLNDWDAAVKQAVATYGDGVKTWEIWNEPSLADANLGYFDGSPQTYVMMLQVAYSDIKAADPTDTVIGLGGMSLYQADNQTINIVTTQSLSWANQTVQLGAMNFCDAIAVHAYPYGQYISLLVGPSFSYYLQQYKRLCPGKPIWVTEVGTESQSTTWEATQSQQSSFLSQSYTLFQNAGVKAYLWYELSDNYTAISGSNFGLFDNNGNQKQAFSTFAQLVNGAASSISTPTATLTPSQTPPSNATATPQTSANPSQANKTPVASSPPESVPEENFAFCFVALVTASFAFITILKRPR